MHPRVSACQVFGLGAPSESGQVLARTEDIMLVPVGNLEYKNDLAASITITSLRHPLSALPHSVLSNQFLRFGTTVLSSIVPAASKGTSSVPDMPKQDI